MTKFALYVPLQAKPGKEKEVADFLRSAVPLVNAEPGEPAGNVSAHVCCPLLVLALVSSLWFRWQLKHRRLLSLG